MNNRNLNKISGLIVEQIITEARSNELTDYVLKFIKSSLGRFSFIGGLAARWITNFISKTTFNISSLLSRSFDANKCAGYVRRMLSTEKIRFAKSHVGYFKQTLPGYGLSASAVNNFIKVVNAL